MGRKYELVGAKSGAEALEILGRDQNFDVILMDLQMPKMDGYEAAMRIKQMPGCEDIPLIFITAVFNEDPQIKRGYEVGAVDYFTKPFDPDILRMKIDVYSSFRHKNAILKARERQLQESEEVLRAGRKLADVLEGLPVGVIIADVDGRIGQMNEEALRVVKASTAAEFVEWWKRNEPRFSPGHAKHQLVRVECVDRTAKHLLASTSPLRNADGDLVGAVVVMQDVTERKTYEADFEERIARLVSLGVELERASVPP